MALKFYLKVFLSIQLVLMSGCYHYSECSNVILKDPTSTSELHVLETNTSAYQTSQKIKVSCRTSGFEVKNLKAKKVKVLIADAELNSFWGKRKDPKFWVSENNKSRELSNSESSLQVTKLSALTISVNYNRSKSGQKYFWQNAKHNVVVPIEVEGKILKYKIYFKVNSAAIS